MRPCAVRTRFHAPAFGPKSFTVFVTMPLSQRKRSPPRTATRLIQPRSFTAAAEVSAAISTAGASNSRGVSTHRYSESLGGFAVDARYVASVVDEEVAAMAGSVMVKINPAMRRSLFLQRFHVAPHPDYSRGIGCIVSAR